MLTPRHRALFEAMSLPLLLRSDPGERNQPPAPAAPSQAQDHNVMKTRISGPNRARSAMDNRRTRRPSAGTGLGGLPGGCDGALAFALRRLLAERLTELTCRPCTACTRMQHDGADRWGCRTEAQTTEYLRTGT